MEQREAGLRREMEEREKLHTDTVERLQVRGDFSIPNDFLYWAAACLFQCLTLVITDGAAGEERPGNKEPLCGLFSPK